MKFKIINDKASSLSNKGYRFVSNAPRFWDNEIYKIVSAYKGINYLEHCFDEFYKGCNPICKGKDGKTYSVHFEFDGNTIKPLIWQEVETFTAEN